MINIHFCENGKFAICVWCGFYPGFARFVVNGQAVDSCEGGDTEIDSALVYQEALGELHIVFDSFNCILILDPFYGLDESKYQQVYGEQGIPETTEDGAQSLNILIALIIGLIIAYLE